MFKKINSVFSLKIISFSAHLQNHILLPSHLQRIISKNKLLCSWCLKHKHIVSTCPNEPVLFALTWSWFVSGAVTILAEDESLCEMQILIHVSSVMIHPEMYKISASCCIMHQVLGLFASITQHRFIPEVVKILCEEREHPSFTFTLFTGGSCVRNLPPGGV